jgi:hypothetical protein
MVEWSKYKPNLRDGFDFGLGLVVGKVILPRVQGYVSREIKNGIKHSYEEIFAEERAELYRKIDLLSNQITELTKRVGASA